MKNINNDYEKWLYIGPFALFWLILVQISGSASVFSLDTISQIPSAVTYAGIFYLIFSKFLWKLRIFHPWLVPYPNLQGTWVGSLNSTWKNEKTGKQLDPIPIQICIHQDFENIHITMFTKESESLSQAAKFITETDGTMQIKFTYTNKPKATVRDRSEIHEGAASLKVTEIPHFSLVGDYWTSRRTTGDIEVKKKSRKLIDFYADDLA